MTIMINRGWHCIQVNIAVGILPTYNISEYLTKIAFNVICLERYSKLPNTIPYIVMATSYKVV